MAQAWAKPALRLRAFALHGWLGLAFSLYFAALFATGTLIVFDKEIDRFLARPVAEGSAPVGGFGAVFDHLGAALPSATVTSIGQFGDDWEIGYRIGSQRYFAWVDGASGTISAIDSRLSFQRVIRDIHAHLLTGHWLGRVAVTAMGVILIFQIVSGLWTYRRFWRGFWRLPARAQPPRARLGALHRLVALWSAPVLMISALTGLVFMADAFGFYPKEPKPTGMRERDAALPAGFGGAQVDAAVGAAVMKMPDLTPIAVDLPTRTRSALKVTGRTGAVLVQTKINQVLVDPADGAVLDHRHGAEMSAFGRVYAAAFPLHYGDFAGQGSKAIWAIGGVFGTILALSGAYVSAARIAGGRGGIGTVWHAVPILFRLGLIGTGLLAIGMYVIRYA